MKHHCLVFSELEMEEGRLTHDESKSEKQEKRNTLKLTDSNKVNQSYMIDLAGHILTMLPISTPVRPSGSWDHMKKY